MNHLITVIVPKNQGDFIAEAAREAGAAGATILLGRGTAKNNILQMLGLGDSEKDIVFIADAENNCDNLYNAIVQAVPPEKKHFGIAFSIKLDEVLKNGKNCSFGRQNGEIPMKEEETTHELITVIVNSGYADDIMAAARKAGAGGGTIIKGHGTGKPEDTSFFGITIVPEKELLLILVEKGKSEQILQTIRNLSCLSQPGSGIAYSCGVHNFTPLGKKE